METNISACHDKMENSVTANKMENKKWHPRHWR
jgi:hypothetical protein